MREGHGNHAHPGDAETLLSAPINRRERAADGEFRDWMYRRNRVGLQPGEVSHRLEFLAANLRSIYEAHRGTPTHCARTR